VGSVTTKELPAASTALVLSPVAVPEGSGLGASSAKHRVESAVNNPEARRMTAQADKNDARRERLCGGFIISGCSCL
jgi:galactokinase/mevalonate kinase-like predicted kinase